MRAAHVVVAIMFLIMAAIQLNDPDPAYWFVVYAVVAAIAAARMFGRRLTATTAIASGMVLAGLLVAAPGFVDYPNSADYAPITGMMMAEKA